MVLNGCKCESVHFVIACRLQRQLFYAGENEAVEWIDEQYADVTQKMMPVPPHQDYQQSLKTILKDHGTINRHCDCIGLYSVIQTYCELHY